MSRIENTVKELDDAQEFLVELDKYVSKNFVIEGKTIDQWKRFFEIPIPDDVSFQTVVELSKRILKKYQLAAYYRDKHTISISILEQSKADEYYSAYNTAQEDNKRKYNKPLAAESCKVSAMLATRKWNSATTMQKSIRDFWAKTCDTLTELRKNVEQLGRALASDAYSQKDIIYKG